MLFKNNIFHQNNLKLAFGQVTNNANIRLVLTFDVKNIITNSIIHWCLESVVGVLNSAKYYYIVY